jgi:glycosyltransferase involved in cell wall biosynthesis
MKILFINTGPWGTGSFSTTHELMKVFEHYGHRIKIFYPDNNLPDSSNKLYYKNNHYIVWKFPIQKDNVSIDSFPLMLSDPNARSTKKPILFKDLTDQQLNFYFATLQNNLKKIIDEFKPDIIDTQHIWSNGYVVNRLSKKYFVTAHNSDQIAFIKDQRMRKFAKIIAKNASAIFVSTEFLKEKIIDLYGVNEEKIYISPNGYDQTIFKPKSVDRNKLLNQLSLDIPENATIITCIAKISETKGIDILLKANLSLTNADNIHFIVFGAGDADTFLKEHQLPHASRTRVHFVGHQSAETIAQINNIAKLSVLPSRNEGFPLAILESMGCGIPMIVSQACDLNKIGVGASFPLKHPELLAQAIRKIMSLSKEKYDALCHQALKTTKQYNWKTIGLKRLEIYKKNLSVALM